MATEQPEDHTFVQMFLHHRRAVNVLSSTEEELSSPSSDAAGRTCAVERSRWCLSSSEEGCLYHQQTKVPHRRRTIMSRVNLFQLDLTSSKQTFHCYLNDIRNFARWFLVDLRIEDDVLKHFSFLSVMAHLVSQFDGAVAVVVHHEQQQVAAAPETSLESTLNIITTTTIPPIIDWHLSVSVLLLGVIPAVVAISSGTLLLALFCHWNKAEALLLTSLVALFLVECLAPLALTASLALYVWNELSGPNAIATTLLVWLASLTSSRLLRQVISPNLGVD